MNSEWKQIWEALIRFAPRSPALMSGFMLLLVTMLVRYLITRPKRLNYPVIDLGEPGTYRKTLMEAALKYPDTPFILPLDGGVVILPITMMNEIRNLPEEQISFTKEIKKMFHYEYTGIGEERPEVNATIKIDLTRHIASTLDGLQDEIRFAFDKELGSCENWTTFSLYPKLARIVALLSGRVFVGRPLSRNEDWIHSSIQYAMDCDGARRAVMKYPVYVRKFIVPFLPEIKRLTFHKKRGAQLLEPILKKCLENHGKEKITSEDYQDEQAMFMSWVLNHVEDKASMNQDRMVTYQMILSFAAIHTTTTTACQVIFDLIARPEYFQPLRHEIEQVIQEDGHDVDEAGFLKLKKASLTKLKKLDSFLKESQRVNPLGLLNMIRLCTAPLTLSNGQTLPKGTRFAFNSHAVHFSPETTTFSPAYNPPSTLPPSEFDGFRFSNLRSMSGKENKHQFVTTSPDSIAFGHGNHACPGRFFASNEIKVVLIELLRSWEVRILGDTEGVGGVEKRPKNYENKMSIVPDMTAEVEFRRRKV